MTRSIVLLNRFPGPREIAAALMAFCLISASPAIPVAPALAAPPATAPSGDGEAQGPGQELDMKALTERLRELGEAIRNAIDDARRAIQRREDDPGAGRGGLGGLAPDMHGRKLRAVYGPRGPTLRSVKALLNYRLVLLGNDRLTAGRIFERDSRIIAEVVTAKEKALVARYMINKRTGVWVPEM